MKCYTVSPKGLIQQNITTLSIEIFPPQKYIKKGKPSYTQSNYYPRPTNYLGQSHIFERVALISRGIPFLVGRNHLSLKYLFTPNIPIGSYLGRREILIVAEISNILVDFNRRIPMEGRSSRPLIGIMPKELLWESQGVFRPRKSKVSIVGNDMVSIMLRGMLEREVVCSICLYGD